MVNEELKELLEDFLLEADERLTRIEVSLLAAVEAFRASEFFRSRLGDDFVDYLATIKRSEWNRYHASVSEWEEREYLSLF